MAKNIKVKLVKEPERSSRTNTLPPPTPWTCTRSATRPSSLTIPRRGAR